MREYIRTYTFTISLGGCSLLVKNVRCVKKMGPVQGKKISKLHPHTIFDLITALCA